MKFFKHLRVVLIHKWHVFCHSVIAGIIWQGLIHDLSKFRPSEFFRSVKYFQGTASPVYKERQLNQGSSMIATLHTKRNRHHYEYWIDYTKDNIVVRRMPYRYTVEYVCDILAASKAYSKKNFSFQGVYEFFTTRMNNYLMHPDTKRFICICLLELKESGYKALRKKRTKALYKQLETEFLIYNVKLNYENIIIDKSELESLFQKK